VVLKGTLQETETGESKEGRAKTHLAKRGPVRGVGQLGENLQKGHDKVINQWLLEM